LLNIAKIKTMNLQSRFEVYQKLLEEGAFMQIIEEFYSEDIIQIENMASPLKGKALLHQQEEKNIEGVNSVDVKINNKVIDSSQGLVMGEMFINFDSKKKGKTRIEEAFIQKWEDGKIVYQRFYYGPFQKG